MFSLYSALTLTLLASAPTTGSTAWVKDGEVVARFYDLTKIYGPLKFYVSSNGYPAAGCESCPTGGTAAEYVVEPLMVYQTWPQGGRYLQVTFPTSAVGGMEQFYYTVVSCLASEDRYLDSGAISALAIKGGGRK